MVGGQENYDAVLPCNAPAGFVVLWEPRFVPTHRPFYQYRCALHARRKTGWYPVRHARAVALADVRGAARDWCQWSCSIEEAAANATIRPTVKADGRRAKKRRLPWRTGTQRPETLVT